jgi:peptidoglycan DL-endopeptidase LytE
MRHSMKVVVASIVMLAVPTLVFAAKTHRVRKHETLYSLAKKYHVSLNELKSANNLVNNQVRVGDKLVIPSRSTASDDNEHGRSSAATYKIRKGDTLTRIARKTGVSVRELRKLNSLGRGVLRPGKVLVLKESEGEGEARPRHAKNLQLRYNDLFNEKDYEQSLAELSEPDPDRPVDLTKNMELKADTIKTLKSKAYCFLGTRYRFGGTTKRGIDCSSFVQQVFQEMDVNLPRTAREQFKVGYEVPPSDLQKGDLIFFRTYASFPSHVGIYLGNNRMIHASSTNHRVVISSLNSPYYRARFIGAKRIAKINPDVFRFDDLVSGVEEESAEEAQANDALGLDLAQ